ncbi:MAG: DUF1573 domain-containing protein [Isosphaeraceae bacterium]
MKRWLLLVLLVVGLSAGATFLASTMPTGELDTRPTARPIGDGPFGKAVLDPSDPVYNFGTMPYMDSDVKTWIVRNEGKGDLTLTKGTSTCMCTIANIAEGEKSVLKPGEETKINLTWETKSKGHFQKSATIVVGNDPEVEELQFVVEGNVEAALVTIPAEPNIDLGSLPNDGSRVVPVALSSPDRPELKIESVKVSNPERIKVTTRSLKDDERKYLKMGPGYKIEVEVTPGKELGSFADEVIVTTDHPLQKDLTLTVSGRIVGPISVVPERLRAHNISSRAGEVLAASIWVRGGSETNFTVESKPEALKVAVTPDDAKLLSTDMGRRYHLTVTVPPGTLAGQIRGEIILKTDHPRADLVKIPVDILVQSSP